MAEAEARILWARLASGGGALKDAGSGMLGSTRSALGFSSLM